MTAEAVVAIGVVVSGASQLAKQFKLFKGRKVLLFSLVVSLFAVLAYGVSFEPAFSRQLIWPYLNAWVAVTGTSIGVYEMTKNSIEAAQGKKDSD